MSARRTQLQAGSLPPERGACRGCGAPIVWARTVAGARMPLDRLRVLRTVDGVAEIPSDDTHWVSCPRKGEFRRPRAAGKRGA